MDGAGTIDDQQCPILILVDHSRGRLPRQFAEWIARKTNRHFGLFADGQDLTQQRIVWVAAPHSIDIGAWRQQRKLAGRSTCLLRPARRQLEILGQLLG